jgi:hypothetical protein
MPNESERPAKPDVSVPLCLQVLPRERPADEDESESGEG